MCGTPASSRATVNGRWLYVIRSGFIAYHVGHVSTCPDGPVNPSDPAISSGGRAEHANACSMWGDPLVECTETRGLRLWRLGKSHDGHSADLGILDGRIACGPEWSHEAWCTRSSKMAMLKCRSRFPQLG